LTKLGKAYGQSEEHVENSRNMLGTHLGVDEKIWEVCGNTLGTTKIQKNPTTPTLPKREKKTGCIECMLQFLIG
jgi:hypothetical protein